MTLLSICQAACSVAPIGIPAFIVGNADETAMLLLSLATQAAETLSRRPQNGWVSMIREYTFSSVAIAAQPGTIANVGGVAVISGLSGIDAITANLWQASGTGLPNNAIVASTTPTTVTLNVPSTVTGSGTYTFGQSDYPLPSDYASIVDGTIWDRTRYWQMRGPQSPQAWQMYKSSVIGRASIQRRFRMRSARNDVGNINVTYFCIDPVPYDNGASFVFEYASTAWCQSGHGVPQTQWLRDTDTGILDEYLLQLAVTYRLLRRLGLSYSEELSEYEQLASQAVAADGGMPVLNIAGGIPSQFISPYLNVPESGFGT